MAKKKTKKKSAIDTMLEWDYNPSEIERRVEERPLTEKEKEIIKKVGF